MKKQTHKNSLSLWKAIFCLLLSLALAVPYQKAWAGPNIVTVTTTALTKSLDGACDFAEALQVIFQVTDGGGSNTYNECSAGPGQNEIVFSGAAAGGVITIPTLGAPDLWVHGDTVIMGPVTFNGGGSAGDLHVLNMAPDATLTLIGVTIRDAHTSGGGPAILNLNHATINIIGSSFINNTADNDSGAIDTNGNLNISTSNFSGNKAKGLQPGSGYGGAVNFRGYDLLKISMSSFAGNTSAGGGGALAISLSGSASAEITDSAFSGNLTSGSGGGGAIYNQSSADTPVNITRGAFSGNISSGGDGGAIYNTISSNLAITDTSFNANIAGTPAASQMGGAIYNQSPYLRITRSAFLGNTSLNGSGGALVVDRGGSAKVANSTFNGNSAPNGDGGGVLVIQTQGGGPQTTFTGLNLTFSANEASASGHGGGIFNSPGQKASLGNTLLDGSSTGNCGGAIQSLGHNLDSGTTCGFSAAGDISSGIANLDTPGFNGGPLSSLLTQKLLVGSAAIDAGDPTICSKAPVNDEDQRGKSRPKDGDGNGSSICDIGSFEKDTAKPGFSSTPVKPGPVDFGVTQVNVATTAVFSMTNTGDINLLVSNPVKGGAYPGDFGITTSFPQTIFPKQTVSIKLTCIPTAVGTRSATLTFASNDADNLAVQYNLTCESKAVPSPGYSSVPAPGATITFPDTLLGSSSNAVFKIHNTGNASLAVSTPTLGGDNPGDFQVLTPFPLNLPSGGADQTVNILCSPSDIGVRTATLSLATNDSTSNQATYNLVCQGKPVPTPYLAQPGTSYLSILLPVGFTNPYGVAFSPDSRFAFVTSYTGGQVMTMGQTSLGGLPLYANRSHVSNADLVGARLLAVSPDGTRVFVASQLSSSLQIFVVDQTNGALAHLYTFKDGVSGVTGLSGAYGVAVSPDGNYVYVSSNGSVGIIRRNANGSYQYIGAFSHTDLNGAHGLKVSPDGQNLYVTAYANSTTGRVVVLKRNPFDGSLSRIQARYQGDCVDQPYICIFPLNGLKGAFQLTISPDGSFVYVASTYSSSVLAFRRSTTGTLSLAQVLLDGVTGLYAFSGISGITITPDGSHVFTSSFNDKAVTTFERDPSTGLLTLETINQRNGAGQPALDGARDTAMSPDGQMLLTAAWTDNAVVEMQKINPKATLTSLLPGSLLPNSRATGVTVKGSDFLPGSVVEFNGANHATTYVDSTTLKFTLSQADIATPGAYPVLVINPLPGGGASHNALNFVVLSALQSPVPSIDHLAPQSVVAGSVAPNATLIVDVYGAGFANTSIVRWNGQNRTTSYVSGAHLTVTLLASDVGQPGLGSVSVANGSTVSNASAFQIAAPGENPAPTITALNPTWVWSHGAASQQALITVSGSNFIEGASVLVNGASRPTTFVDGTHLQVLILGSDLLMPGSLSISVTNPPPGGGLSSSLPFVVKPLYTLYLFLRK